MKIKIENFELDFDLSEFGLKVNQQNEPLKQRMNCSVCKNCVKISEELGVVECGTIDQDPIIKIPVECFDFQIKK